MKIFISYRYTGEDPLVLKDITNSLVDSLQKAGHTSFCSFGKNQFFVEQKYTYKQILDYALAELDNSDYVLAFVKSKEKSEGMLLELGYALARGKKIILALQSGISVTFLPEIAERVIVFERLDDLYTELENLLLKES